MSSQHHTPASAVAPSSAEVAPPSLPAHLDRARLVTSEAAEYFSLVWGLKIAPQTLNKYRTVGGGPQFRKFSHRVVYDRTALDEWAAAKLSEPKGSTSEP